MAEACHAIVDRPDIRIDHFRGATKNDALVFIFGEYGGRLLAGSDAVMQFLLKNGFDVVAIKTNRDIGQENFVGRELAEVERWLSWTTRPYQRRVGYGSEKGAFAAMRFSRTLKLERVLALSPQFGSPMPVEDRLEGVRSHLSDDCRYLVVFDPCTVEDEPVLRFLSMVRAERLRILPLPHSGHPVGPHLIELKALGPLLFNALSEGRLPAIAAMRRGHRARSPIHLYQLAEHCLRRNHPGWALAINEQLSGIEDHPKTYAQASIIFEQLGRHREALAAIACARSWRGPKVPNVDDLRNALLKRIAAVALEPLMGQSGAATGYPVAGAIDPPSARDARETVRLVIWDLDETFWKGTVTEGGITEYVQAHHDIVITLARRGIMSSICSKNDADTILPILQEKGIADYFIFPSIDWNPKGPRLAALIEAVQLRPATVMFIDDNPGNRAEAERLVPGLQVEDEHFIARLLDDPRFRGKNDDTLSRLAQYKLLETRKRDERQASGDNAVFLRSCDIRVRIEYDVLSHLDRAIELVNRTNQLNFTKSRLPEDPDEARAILADGVNNRWRQSGLVHVADKYGDYGFVGFFMLENGVLDPAQARLTQKVHHYCFSCRTLGMQVERWLYERLQRPRITVTGDVLTDLNASGEIDWIRMVSSIEAAAPVARAAPEIRIHGGCEAASVAHYLGAHSGKVVTTGNFFGGSHFIRVNGASLLLSACDRHGEAFRREAEALRIPYEMLTNDYFKDVPEGTLFVFGGQYDSPGPFRYRHKEHGWEFRFEPPRPQILGVETPDMTKVTQEEFDLYLSQLELFPKVIEDINTISWHINRNYESIPSPSHEQITVDVCCLLDRVPQGSKIVFMTDHDHIRYSPELFRLAPGITRYNELMATIVAPHSFATIVSFSDAILDESEILIGGNHYDRMVYCRMAERIIEAARELEPKSGEEPTARVA
jgi:FkbH-like protein